MISISHENNHNTSEIYEIVLMDHLLMENHKINCNLNHTIGSLLSGYIYEHYFCQSQQVLFISYNKKHNSDNCIYLYLTLSDYLSVNNKDKEISEFIIKCIGELIEIVKSNKNVFSELVTKNE
jgi:DNA-directed RNA polymerase subunit L